MKAHILSFFLLFVSLSVTGETVNFNIKTYAEANSWENGTAYSSATINGHITATKGGTGNNGKYYTENYSWRFYENNSGAITLTTSSGTFSSVTFTYKSVNSGVLMSGVNPVTSGSAVPISGNSVTFSVSHSSGSSSGNVQITAISVTYTPAPSCLPLAEVSGDVGLGQCDTPDPTKLKASWEFDHITGIESLTLKVYDSEDNLVKTIEDISPVADEEEYEITGLTPCVTYYATITAVADDGYCDGIESAASGTCTTNGYTLTVNKNDVTLSAGSEPSAICSNVSATYTADSGYDLPTSVTVTNAGAEGTGWTWNSGTGVLTINKANVTGNVIVTVSGVAQASPYQLYTAWANSGSCGSDICNTWDWTGGSYFVQVGSSNEWRISNYTIPEYEYDAGNNRQMIFNVAGQNATNTKFYDLPLAVSQGTAHIKKGAGAGAVGTLRIYDNSGDNNGYIGFVPGKYILRFGGHDYLFSSISSTVQETDIQTLDAADLTELAQYRVGVTNSSDGFVAINEGCSAADVTGVSGMGQKSGAGDSWGSNLAAGDAGKTGKFRIWLDNAVNNFNVHFVPYYELTYDANGGTGAAPAAVYISCEATGDDRNVTVAANMFTRTGYSFEEWNTQADGNGTTIATGSRALTSTLKLYAVWSAKTISITLDKNNSDIAGTADGSAAVSYDADALSSISHATRTGYTLDGYYTLAEGGVKVLNANGTFASNSVSGYITAGNWTQAASPTTLYAHWTINNYTVTWKWKDNETYTTGVTDANNNADYGATVSVPTAPADNAIGSCADKFIGWSATDLGYTDGQAAPADLFTATSPAITGNTTFHAVFAERTGAPIGTKILTETWTGVSTAVNNKPAYPSASATTYAGSSITYTFTQGTTTSVTETKLTNDSYAGGSSPEIIIGQGSLTGGAFSASGLPKADAKELTLTYKQNNNTLNLSVSGEGYSISKVSGSGAGTYTYTITCGTASTFTLTMAGTTGSNVRVDDIDISVKTPTYTNYRTKCDPTKVKVTYNANGGVSVCADEYTTIGEDYIVCSSTPTRSNFAFRHWTDGSGNTYEPSETIDGGDVDSDITLTAVWRQTTFSITYDKNTSIGSGTVSMTPMPTDANLYETGQTVTTAAKPATATNSGYDFSGWNTQADGAGTHVNASETIEMGEEDMVLYAEWTPKQDVYIDDMHDNAIPLASTQGYYTVPTLSDESEAEEGICSVRHYDFIGWTAKSNVNADGTLKGGASIVESGTSRGANGTEYHAVWDDNTTSDKRVSCPTWLVTYDANIESPTGVVPDASPYEENEDVTLASGLSKSGYRWDGWQPKQGGTPIDVTDGKFTMPAAAVTVEGQWTYMRPALSASDLYVTSSKDITVMSSMQLTATASAAAHTSGTLTIANEEGSEGGLFHAVITDADAGIEGLNAVIRIEYTPTAYNIAEETAVMTATIGGYSSSFTVHGRSLPQDFIVAAARGGVYSALPADLGVSNTHTGYAFASDNAAAPAHATVAPASAVFNLYAHQLKASDFVRLASKSSKATLWSSTSNGIREYAGIDGGSAKGDQYEWQLATNDNISYTLYNSAAQSGSGSYLGVNSDRKWGVHAPATGPVTVLRFLPVDDIADMVTLEASEWTATSFTFTASTSPLPDAHHIRAEALSTDYEAVISGSTLSSPTIDFAELAGKQVMIQWCSEEDDIIAQGAVIVPIIIDEHTETNLSQFDSEILRDMDIYVVDDKELKLTASTQVHNIQLNSGSSLNIATTDADAGITVRLNSLSIQGGWNAAQNRYDMPRIYIDPKSTLNKSVNTVNLDLNIYNAAEGRHYYPFAVPFPVAVSSIDYANPTLAAASVYGKHYVIKTYDGARRAENGADKDNNWTVVADDATLQPGTGYIVTAVAVGGKAVLRIPISFTNAWTTLGEQGTVDAVTKNISSVTAHTGTAATVHSRHAGWNFLGVPYMSCFGTSEAMYDGEEEIPYVSVPSHDFAEYFQTDITETELRPGWGFFIQAGSTGILNFLSSDRQEDEDAPLYIKRRAEEKAPKYKTAVQLTAATGKRDKTTFIFSDRYTPDYEIGADLEKMFGDGYTLALYSIPDSTPLAFNAAPIHDETIPLGYRVPEDGTYTLALPENTGRYDLSHFEHLYLIDYLTGELTDLMTNSYSFTSIRTQDETRFALAPVFRKDSPTGTENAAGGNETDNMKAQKTVINGILYIVRDGRIYNATGAVINNK